ncbi:MAG: hypothetical protein AMXMBFR66_18560 [Pseudomonadota bacterium]|jgi:hypothetical protein
MKSLALLHRTPRRSTLGDASSLRMEVRPPSLCHAPDSAWQRIMFWLLAPAPYDAAPPLGRMPSVRTDFLATIADIDTSGADALRERIAASGSLRDLWHLRSELYRIIGLAHAQAEADRRLALLARHFPTRAPRPQLAPL